MIIYEDEIKKLLYNDNITGYEIEKHTGISRVTISKIRRGVSKVDNMLFENIKKLQQYINENKSVK